MLQRTANAVWEGNLRNGKGKMRLGSGAYEGQYSFASRFESGTGTNPEELIAAAHAGCFSMALSAGLAQAGYEATRIATEARVFFEKPVICREILHQTDVRVESGKRYQILIPQLLSKVR